MIVRGVMTFAGCFRDFAFDLSNNQQQKSLISTQQTTQNFYFL
jgi:hypothetical protein